MDLTSSEVLALVTYLEQDDNLPGILAAVKAKLEAYLSPAGPPNPFFGLVSPVRFRLVGFELLVHIQFLFISHQVMYSPRQ